MDFLAHTEQWCCVMCPFCKVSLMVEVPWKLMEVVQVNCGHCNKISFCSPIAPMFQSILSPEYQMSSQGSCFTDYRRNQPLPPAVPSATYEPASPKTPFVVKPPEKKHRLPSAYNRFMRDEIQRIKAAKPDIPHREAFSMAAKNWAKNDPVARQLFHLLISLLPKNQFPFLLKEAMSRKLKALLMFSSNLSARIRFSD